MSPSNEHRLRKQIGLCSQLEKFHHGAETMLQLRDMYGLQGGNFSDIAIDDSLKVIEDVKRLLIIVICIKDKTTFW